MKIINWIKSFWINLIWGDEYYRSYWKTPVEAYKRPVLASQRMVVEIMYIDGSVDSFEL